MDNVLQERDDKLLNMKIENEVKKYGILKNAFVKIAESESGKLYILNFTI